MLVPKVCFGEFIGQRHVLATVASMGQVLWAEPSERVFHCFASETGCSFAGTRRLACRLKLCSGSQGCEHTREALSKLSCEGPSGTEPACQGSQGALRKKPGSTSSCTTAECLECCQSLY